MLDLSRRLELDWLAQIVADLRSAAPRLELLLVGALARDLLLHYGHGVKIQRMTNDTDFAVAVADWSEFTQARDALLASGLFAPYRGAAHKLQHARHGRIDLIPFGAVERPDGTIAWPPDGDEVMEVIGYAEAAATSITVFLPHGQTARTVSLPMLATLKVFAWRDRHRTTQGKDAIDLGLILHSYLEAGNVERLYSEFLHVVTDDFDFELTSGWLLGRDARAALMERGARFDEVIGRLDSILSRELSGGSPGTLALQLNPVEPDRALRLLAAFRAGLLGVSTP